MTFASLLAGAALCALSGALGTRLLRFMKVEPGGAPEHAALAMPLGMVVVSHAGFALGLAGELRPGPAAAILAVLVALAVPGSVGAWRWARALLGRWGEGLPFARTARTACLLLTVVGIVATLAPPTGADTVKYHLAAPAVWVAEGAIRFKPFLHFNQPMALEVMGALGLLFGAETTQLVVHLGAGVASAAALWAVARAVGAEAASPLALLLYFAAPLNLSESIGHCQDYGVTLGGFGALLAFLRWKDGAPDAWMLAGGAAVGLGAASKYTGLYAAVAVFFLAVAAAALDPRCRRARPFLYYAAGAVAAAGPWYLRNWIEAGNPVWPAFYEVLGGEGWNAAAAAVLRAETVGRYHVLGEGPLALLAGPVALAAVPQAVFENSGGLGVATGALAPLLVVLGRATLRERWPVFAFSAIVYLCWFPLAQNGRFLWAGWGAAAILVAEGALRAGALSRTVRAMVGGAVAFHLALSGVLCFTVLERSLVPLAGLVDRDEYLRRAVQHYDAVRWLNENAPADALVASVPETLYHLRRRYAWVGPHSGAIDRGRISGWEDYLAQVRELGATHLLLSGVEPPANALAALGAHEVYRSPRPLFREYELFWMKPEPSVAYAFSPLTVRGTADPARR